MGLKPNRLRYRSVSGVLALLTAASGFLVLVSNPAEAVVTFTAKPVRLVPPNGLSGHANLYAWGAATRPDGTILIGDYRNYNVAKFKADGTYLGRTMDNQGFAPYGLGVDPRNGDSYIADMERRQIRKFSVTGKFLQRWGKVGHGVGFFQYPSRIAIGSDGRVYVNDTWENHIVVHTNTGQELFTFGGKGPLPQNFAMPHGMDFDRGQPDVPGQPSDDRLYVVDAGHSQVDVFTTEGKHLFSFGSAGTGLGRFQGDMRGLAIDQKNDVLYVVDAGGNNVEKFTLSGQPLLQFGGLGEGPGQFSDGGREVTVDLTGKVWVADMPNYRVQVFNPNGTFAFERPWPAFPPPNGGFNGPRGAAVDKDGNIFVSDTYNQRVQKLSPTGSFLTKWGSRGRDDYAFNYPRMLDVDMRDGSVVIADTDNEAVKKYTNNGTHVFTIGGEKGAAAVFRSPHGVAVGPDGKIYVADTRFFRVQIFDANGNFIRKFGTQGTGPGQFTFPRGIGLDPDGSIWVADSSLRDTVHHFSNTGAYLGKLGDGTLINPFDVEADQNFVYVADTQADNVKVYRKSGELAGTIGSAGKLLGQMEDPQGLEIVPGPLPGQSKLYVTELGNERVQEFLITTANTAAAGPAAVSGPAAHPPLLFGEALREDGPLGLPAGEGSRSLMFIGIALLATFGVTQLFPRGTASRVRASGHI